MVHFRNPAMKRQTRGWITGVARFASETFGRGENPAVESFTRLSCQTERRACASHSAPPRASEKHVGIRDGAAAHEGTSDPTCSGLGPIPQAFGGEFSASRFEIEFAASPPPAPRRRKARMHQPVLHNDFPEAKPRFSVGPIPDMMPFPGAGPPGPLYRARGTPLMRPGRGPALPGLVGPT